jgi:hypothetical protein
VLDVRSILAGTLHDIERIYTDPAVMAEVLQDMQRAELLLAEKLRKESERFGGPDTRYTGASALAFHQHVATAVEYMKGRVSGQTAAQAQAAIAGSLTRTVATMQGLEKRFTGIVTPLRLAEADQMRAAAGTAKGMWARQFPTSVDRYGTKMLGEAERIARAGLLSGATLDDMVGALTGHGGPKGKVSMAAVVTPNGVLRTREEDIPEGLFKRHKYWAERLMRTELAKAYNGARQTGLEEMAKDHPNLRRKILAILDKRTAPDSLAVHGQIRGIKDPFQDGAGRVYLYPPGRPNDRETVIPWVGDWEDSVENTTDWEKACMGELDQAGEDALAAKVEALAQPPAPPPDKKKRGPRKPKAEPVGPPPLPKGLQKALDKLPPHFERSYSMDERDFFPTDEFGSRIRSTDGSSTRFPFKAADLDALMLHGRVVKVDAFVYKVVDPKDALPHAAIPPMQMPAKPAIGQEVEAALRDKIHVQPSKGSWGSIDFDGDRLGDVERDGTKYKFRAIFGSPLYGVDVGEHASAREALDSARAALVRRAAAAGTMFQPWDADKFYEAVAADKPQDARQMVRGLLWQHGVMPRDPFHRPDKANELAIEPDAAMPEAWAYHDWNGRERIRQNIWDRGKPGASDDHRRDVLSTLVHEELHGSSREEPGAYRGPGAAVEEVSVEMAARKITGQALGRPPEQHGAYQYKINEVAAALAHVEAGHRGLSDVLAWHARLSDAGIKMRHKDSTLKTAENPDGLIDQLITALDLPRGYDREVRDRLRQITAP